MQVAKKFTPLLIIIVFVIFTFWELPGTFFQQDEWQNFAANIYYQSMGALGIVQSFFPPDAISHFNPLARAYAWFTFLFFYTNFTPYAWFSIIFHLLNAFLLYYFIFVWLNNRKIAFMAALFFGVNSIPSQAVTWVANTVSYEIPTGFILLSLIFFHRFFIQKEHQRRNIILSFLLLLISLLFHENGVFLFLFYPLMFFFFAKSEWRKLLSTFSYGILIFLFAFVVIRIPPFFGLLSSLPAVTDISHPPAAVYPYRLLSIALKSFSGSFVPEKILIQISDEVVRLAYPQFITADNVANPYISQTIVFDLVSYLLTVFIMAIMFLFIRFFSDVFRKEKLKDIFIWALLFVPTSLFPYAVVLGKAGYASIIEPRFFYVGSVAVSIMVAIIAYLLLGKFSGGKMLKIIVYLLLSLYVFSHLSAVRAYIHNLTKISIQRKTFLTTIKSAYPNLPQKVVFFTKSDTSYYGMPDEEKILPVQVGFGKILMIWYQKEEIFPGCLYEGQYLLRLLEEEYRQCGDRGFGYFRKYDKLIRVLRTNQIPAEDVISYSWNGKTGEFKDITKEIREKLTRDINLE